MYKQSLTFFIFYLFLIKIGYSQTPAEVLVTDSTVVIQGKENTSSQRGSIRFLGGQLYLDSYKGNQFENSQPSSYLTLDADGNVIKTNTPKIFSKTNQNPSFDSKVSGITIGGDTITTKTSLIPQQFSPLEKFIYQSCDLP